MRNRPQSQVRFSLLADPELPTAIAKLHCTLTPVFIRPYQSWYSPYPLDSSYSLPSAMHAVRYRINRKDTQNDLPNKC